VETKNQLVFKKSKKCFKKVLKKVKEKNVFKKKEKK